MVRLLDVISPEAIRVRRREARIDTLAKTITAGILDGTGTIGTRMSLSRQPQPETGEHPLSQELLNRLNNHELLDRTLRFTKRVLPVNLFFREDGKTPYIRHAERTALLYLDLLPKSMPFIEKVVQVAIMLGHDSEEVPQERFMDNEEVRRTGIGEIKPGELTQERVREIFDEEMEGLPKKFRADAERIYDGIQAFNCNNLKPDNSPMSDAEYLAQLEEEGHAAKKIIDRAGDSPLGDMYRIARIIKETPIDDMETWATLTKRYERLVKSLEKAEGLKPMVRRLPKEQRAVEEFYEAILRAGRNFPVEANKRREARFHQRPATEVVIFPQRGPSD